MKDSEICISYGLNKSDDELFLCHGFCDRPGFNRRSRVAIYPKDVLASLEVTKKLCIWVYAKNVSKKHLKYYFDMHGASEDLFFDLAILSGKFQNIFVCIY